MKKLLKSSLIFLTILLVAASIHIVITETTRALSSTEVIDSEYPKSEFQEYTYQEKSKDVYWPAKEWRTAKPEEVGKRCVC